MHDERIFDLADVKALGTAFTPNEIAWATMPASWRCDHTSSAVEWEQNVRWFFDFMDDEPIAVSIAEDFVRSAVGELAQSVGEDASVQFARLAHVERRYVAFLGERAVGLKIGPLFSPLEASWFCRITRPHELRDPEKVDVFLARVSDALGEPGDPLRARLMLENPDATLDQTTVRREAKALIERYINAEAAVLRHAADGAMAEPANAERAPRRARL